MLEVCFVISIIPIRPCLLIKDEYVEIIKLGINIDLVAILAYQPIMNDFSNLQYEVVSLFEKTYPVDYPPLSNFIKELHLFCDTSPWSFIIELTNIYASKILCLKLILFNNY